MANIQIKDAFGRTVFMKASGIGTADDPYVTIQENIIINENLPLPYGAATEETLNEVKSFQGASLGQNGHTFVTTSTPQIGSWVAIQVVETAYFSSLTCTNTTAPVVNVGLPVGFIVYGNISAFTLNYGKVIAYKS